MARELRSVSKTEGVFVLMIRCPLLSDTFVMVESTLLRSALTMPELVFRIKVLLETLAVVMGAGKVMVETAALDLVSVNVDPLKVAFVRLTGKAGLRSALT
jgi:uncharacterized membrane protein YGL010W